MNENRTIKLVEIPIGGKGGFIWNRLHGEREEICEALSKDSADDGKESLQTRLRNVDDALDRLMSGSYGNCSKCGAAIDEAKLCIDPALALCLDCWTGEHGPLSSSVESSDVVLETLNHFVRDLDLPTDLDAAMDVIAAARVRAVDVAEVNGKAFLQQLLDRDLSFLVVERTAEQTRRGVGNGQHPGARADDQSALMAKAHDFCRRQPAGMAYAMRIRQKQLLRPRLD